MKSYERGKEAPMDYQMDKQTPFLLLTSESPSLSIPQISKLSLASQNPNIITNSNTTNTNKQQQTTPLPTVTVTAKPTINTLPNISSRKRRKTNQDDNASNDMNSTSRNSKFNIYSLPYLITGYIHVIFTIFVASVAIYIISQFVITVHHDLRMKAEEYSQEIMHQVAECSKSYIQNKCHPHERIPAIEKLCKDWDTCMKRDPREVGRLKVGAETLAEILNKLIEPLSYKTMIFGVVLIFSTFMISALFSFARQRPSKENVYYLHDNYRRISDSKDMYQYN